MVRNTSFDLNNMLFAQLERLSDDELDLTEEVERAKAISGISKQIIDNSRLAFDATKFKAEFSGDAALPPQLENKTP